MLFIHLQKTSSNISLVSGKSGGGGTFAGTQKLKFLNLKENHLIWTSPPGTPQKICETHFGGFFFFFFFSDLGRGGLSNRHGLLYVPAF